MTRIRPGNEVTRDFTVAVFVIQDGRILLHCHPKLGKWLPPGGHIEPNELPDEAALREVAEETGLTVRHIGGKGLATDYPEQPVQLVVPAGIQLEFIGKDHEHIDLVYFAVPVDADTDSATRIDDAFRWFTPDELAAYPVSEEILDWCARAVREAAG